MVCPLLFPETYRVPAVQGSQVDDVSSHLQVIRICFVGRV